MERNRTGWRPASLATGLSGAVLLTALVISCTGNVANLGNGLTPTAPGGEYAPCTDQASCST